MKNLLMMLMMVFLTTSIFAQETATVNVTAQVQPTLQLNVLNHLEFGNTMAGQTKTITNDSPSAAVVQVVGSGAAGVDVSFTLPTNLTSSGNNLAVSFGATSAGYNTENNTSGITDFDPNSGVSNVSLDGTTGDLFVYLGGTITPTALQPTGTYNGTVTVSVAYN